MTTLRIAMAQLNVAVGAVPENSAKICEYIARAKASHAHLISFPELAVCGYPPEDLLYHPRFIDASLQALDDIAQAAQGIVAVVGFVDRDPDGNLYNAAAVLQNGQCVDVYHKHHLPNYGVFDEHRYFTPGKRLPRYNLGPAQLGVSVCEDIWFDDGPSVQQAAAGARVIISLNASPFHDGRHLERLALLQGRARATGAYVCYNNLVGGQDELVFDGQGVVIAPDGTVLAQGGAFCEELIIADLPLTALDSCPDTDNPAIHLGPLSPLPAPLPPATPMAALPERLELVRLALVTAIRDYLGKNGFSQVLIGLSGGIDSALVAVLAAQALGPENVHCVYMPSRYSSDDSGNDAQTLASANAIDYRELAIENIFGGYLDLLAPSFEGTAPNEAEENLQARIRGNLLMALSNKFGWMVLTTGNKSEMAVGYATLYGDMAGGFAVIKDLPKALVYELSRYLNQQAGRELIPHNTITKAPTAELRADQLDTDSLPPYEILDPILAAYVEDAKPINEIVAMGFDEATVRRMLRLVDLAEYKRRQAPPGIRITPRAFGRDRRMPITNRFRE